MRAKSDDACRRLIERFVAFYGQSLFNPTWGEQVAVRPDNTLSIGMVFQGIDAATARATWQSFFDWISGQPADYTLAQPPFVAALPAANFWDAAWLKANVPQLLLSDDRPDAPAGNVFWRGNLNEAGWFLHGYESLWLPEALLEPASQARLVEALFAGSRRWRIGLHFNKGLAGGPVENRVAARQAATNPAAADAFALAISGAEGPPAIPGIAGHAPDLARARREAGNIAAAMATLRGLVSTPGAYVSESNFFEADWQSAFWGTNYARLRQVKDRYDPEGLFFVHHGVGSEDWSPDGFTRLKA